MRDRDKIPASQFTGFFKPRPQVTGERAVIKAKRGKCLRLLCVNVARHNAMQVSATRDQ